MTVLLDKNVDIETIKEETAKAESKDEQSDKDVLAQNEESDAGQNLFDLPESPESIESETTESETTQTKSNEEE